MVYLVFGRGFELRVALKIFRVFFLAEQDLLAVSVDNNHLVVCRFTALGKSVRDAAAGGLRQAWERVKSNARQAMLRAAGSASEGAGALEPNSGKVIPVDAGSFPEGVGNVDPGFGDLGAGFDDPPQSEEGDDEQPCEVFGGPADA